MIARFKNGNRLLIVSLYSTQSLPNKYICEYSGKLYNEDELELYPKLSNEELTSEVAYTYYMEIYKDKQKARRAMYKHRFHKNSDLKTLLKEIREGKYNG